MFDMLLAAEETANTAPALSGWDLAMQYIIYGVIIVLSIVILILIRRRTRLPRHDEIKSRLDKLHEEVVALKGPSENRMDFVKRAARVLYLADDLAYTTALLSSKERYSDFGTISSLLGDARSELVPYKYGKKECADCEGLDAAEQKVAKAVSVMDGILERDSDIKRRRKSR